MPETLKVLTAAAKEEQLKNQNLAARNVVQNEIGIRVDDLDAKDYARLGQSMAKFKKSAEWVISFDGDWFAYYVRVGSDKASKIDISSVRLSEESDLEKRKKILSALVARKAAAQAQVDAFYKAHPDPEALAELKKQIDDLGNAVKTAEALIPRFQKFKFETDDPGMFGGLETWTDKHSLSHYVEFLFLLKAPNDPQAIFDTYIKVGASLPVNLRDATRIAIERDLKAGKKPDFTHARAEILQVVDGKIIPAYRREAIAGINKQVAAQKKDLETLIQRYRAMGGK
ncbi:MAG TPA: hypothetical protein VFE51_05110 [Verrucomicrobiae bacterium]|nr:hypothetical protein [Verrucomicrobiae bacterium]